MIQPELPSIFSLFILFHLSIGCGVFLFVLDSFARMQPTTNGSTLRGLLLPAARDILLGFGEYSSRCWWAHIWVRVQHWVGKVGKHQPLLSSSNWLKIWNTKATRFNSYEWFHLPFSDMVVCAWCDAAPPWAHMNFLNYFTWGINLFSMIVVFLIDMLLKDHMHPYPL